jgi:hypothetical protein
VEQAMDLSYDRLRNDDDYPSQSAGSVPVFFRTAQASGSRKPSLSVRVPVLLVGALETTKGREARKTVCGRDSNLAAVK